MSIFPVTYVFRYSCQEPSVFLGEGLVASVSFRELSLEHLFHLIWIDDLLRYCIDYDIAVDTFGL